MPLMLAPVFQILRSRSPVPHDEHVLRVPGFGALREIEAASDHGFPVNDHDLVMGDSVHSINLNSHLVAVGIRYKR